MAKLTLNLIPRKGSGSQAIPLPRPMSPLITSLAPQFLGCRSTHGTRGCRIQDSPHTSDQRCDREHREGGHRGLTQGPGDLHAQGLTPGQTVGRCLFQQTVPLPHTIVPSLLFLEQDRIGRWIKGRKKPEPSWGAGVCGEASGAWGEASGARDEASGTRGEASGA